MPRPVDLAEPRARHLADRSTCEPRILLTVQLPRPDTAATAVCHPKVLIDALQKWVVAAAAEGAAAVAADAEVAAEAAEEAAKTAAEVAGCQRTTTMPVFSTISMAKKASGLRPAFIYSTPEVLRAMLFYNTPYLLHGL